MDETQTQDTFETGTAEQMLKTLRSMDIELLAWFYDERIKTLGVPEFMRDYEGEPGCDDLHFEVMGIEGRLQLLPAKRIEKILRDSLRSTLEPISWQDPQEVVVDVMPRFPTGQPELDAHLGGGAYGVTCFAGAPKVGKSMLGISTAVESARAGWRTIYCNAELSRSQVYQRLHAYMAKADEAVIEHLHIANVMPGFTMELFLEELLGEAHLSERKIQYHDTHLLIIVDSINRVVEAGRTGGSEEGYWQLHSDWQTWAMNSMRESEGRISWVLVSELASHGGVKGRNIEYLADVTVRVNATSIEDIVEMDVPYARGSRSGGEVGVLRRDPAQGRFIRGGVDG